MAKTEAKAGAAVPEGNDRVKITLPRARRGEEESLFVSINGVNFLVPKGKEVEVPAYVAEEIRRSQAADEYFHQAAERMLENQQR